MKDYIHLTLPQRYEMSTLHKVGQDPSHIVRVVGVDHTTISCELKRNKSPNGYVAQPARQCIHQRRAQVRRRPPLENGRGITVVWSKVDCVINGAPSRSLIGLDAANLFRYPMSVFTNLFALTETLEARSIGTCANDYDQNE
jgi:hypothetical protein